MIGPKLLPIKFDKVDPFIIRIYDGTRYLAFLFGPEKHDVAYNRIKYLISLKSSITYFFSHNYPKVKFDSNNYLPIQKTLTLDHFIIHTKSVINRD